MPKTNYSFSDGFFMGDKCLSSKTIKVFNWNKAAELIKKHKPKVAYAGLNGDFDNTCDVIYEDSQPRQSSWAYLSSRWAVPLLYFPETEEEFECYIEHGVDEDYKWGASTLWPQESLDILYNEEMKRIKHKDCNE